MLNQHSTTQPFEFFKRIRATVGRDSQFNWAEVTRHHPEVSLQDSRFAR
jgi:hypothetical protein